MARRSHSVVEIDVPTAPAVIRTKFDRPDALGIFSGGISLSVIVISGMKKPAMAMPWTMVGIMMVAKSAWVEKRESLGLFPALLRAPSNQIPEFYGVQENAAERVAGHLADVVEITPKDALRFGYRIWSEKKTGLVVKMQTLGEQGTVLEQVAFTELQLDAPVRMDKLKQLMNDTKGYELHKPVLRKTTPEAEGWRLKEPVPGFLPMSCHTRDPEGAPAGGAPMQWVFSDGLASVSLFVEPYDATRHMQEKSAVMGATHSVTRRLGSHWLTAMGEVPPVTLRRFALALERTR